MTKHRLTSPRAHVDMEVLGAQLRSLGTTTGASDPDDDVAALLVDRTDTGEHLDAAFETFSSATQDLVVAHGRWAHWRPEAGALAGLTRPEVDLAAIELQRAGWVAGGAYPLAVRAWRRARLRPTSAMSAAAADEAEEAFHQFRYAGAADGSARKRLMRWSRWSEEPEVSQWGAIAREEVLGDEACDRCRPWACIEASRAARWRSWYEQAARWLDRAEAEAPSPRVTFFVRFLRAIRGVEDGASDAADQVKALAASVASEGDWFFVYQAQASLNQFSGGDPRPPLRHGVALAQRMGLRAREAHLRLLLVLAEWPDGARMRSELELIDLSGLQLSDRDRWNHRWAQVRLHLALDDLQGAGSAAQGILDDDALAALNPGSSWGVVCLAARERGDEEQAEQAWAQARRFLSGPDGDELREWFERVYRGGAYRPLPMLYWGRPASRDWVTRDGCRFALDDAPAVDLSRSPVSVGLLRELVAGPRSAEELIDAAWPGDASSYPSLRNRLHSALRVLRRRGLEDRIRLMEGRYHLHGMRVVDAPEEAADIDGSGGRSGGGAC